MTLEEKLKYMKIMGGLQGEDEDELTAYLDLAKSKLINHIYPYEKGKVELEPRYEMNQVELAIILFGKKGAEGEEQHNENGVNRKYQSEENYLQSIPRHAGLPL